MTSQGRLAPITASIGDARTRTIVSEHHICYAKTDMMRNLFGGHRRLIVASVVAALAFSIVLPFLRVQHAAAWWNGSWLYRRKIMLNNTASSEALVDFPIRVSLSSSNIDYTHTQDSGQDIRFVDSNDSTPLSYEIEKWDESGTSEVWVRVPQIDAGSSDDYIWMYYGNASVADGQAATSVWDSNYAFVHHLKATAACNVTFTDSTANGRNGTCTNGGPAANTTAKIGAGRAFDGTNDFIEIANSTIFDPGSGGQTMELWINTNNTTNYQTLLSRFSTGGWEFYLFALFGTCNSGRICYYDNLGGDQGIDSGISTGTWTHVALVKTGSTVTFYVNGTSVGSVSVATTLANDTREVRIGYDNNNQGPFSGSMDEVRYSSIARSADWMKATYITGNDAMNSFGLEELYPPEPPVLTAVSNNAALQPVFQLRSADPSSPSYLRYKIQVCATSDCSSVVRTIDQTTSQTGWSGQDAQTGTAYAASATVGSSTLASYTYQAPALSIGTQYWWRAYAIDPGGSNSWSEASTIASFITTGPPATPTLVEPIGGVVVPQNPLVLRLRTTDPNSSYVHYKIELCSTSNCSSVVRTIDQTSSQAGWTSKDANSGTAYSTSTVIGDSQVAVHVYQPPYLSANTLYWWRAYAIDPGGYNQWSSASSIASFATGSLNVSLLGGTKVQGGTKIGQ
jgi:hypothetical protein